MKNIWKNYAECNIENKQIQKFKSINPLSSKSRVSDEKVDSGFWSLILCIWHFFLLEKKIVFKFSAVYFWLPNSEREVLESSWDVLVNRSTEIIFFWRVNKSDIFDAYLSLNFRDQTMNEKYSLGKMSSGFHPM